MNNLKFRAWHKEYKKYSEVLFIDFEHNEVKARTTDYDCFYFNTEDLIIEQYTGRKDIIGIELYENDIMTVVWSNQLGETQYSRVVVKNPFEYSMEELPYLYHAHEFIHLGNIHENSELLEVH